MLVGIFAGTIVALSGLGGGIIMVPLFLIVLKKSMHSATALSLSIVPILSISALIKYISITPTHQISSYQTGYLLWIMLIPMLLGVIFFLIAWTENGNQSTRCLAPYYICTTFCFHFSQNTIRTIFMRFIASSILALCSITIIYAQQVPATRAERLKKTFVISRAMN